MRVLEQLTVSKTGQPDRCEDAIYIDDSFACLVDGITAKDLPPINGKSLGRIAAELVCRTINNLSPGTNCVAAFRTMSEAIRSFCRENDLGDDERYLKGISASVAVYNDFRRELWSIGDCRVIVDAKEHTQRNPIDEALALTRALYLELEIAEGKTLNELLAHDTGREFIKPLLRREHLLHNLAGDGQFRLGVLNGFEQDESQIRCFSLGKEVRTVTLASDGYPGTLATLAEAEANLSDVLSRDPLCFRLYRSTKGITASNLSYDDRAYVRLETG
jgi:hypothetical protein